MENPIKKGKLAKTEDDKLVLVNDKNQAFVVDQAVIGIWKMLDGNKTVNEVVQEVAKGTDAKAEQLSPQITAIVDKLKEVGLVI
ncbi:MAG: PqqD family protein [Candidatus Heimdallarchaeota archaeon]